MPKLGLDRQQLASFLPNWEAIRAFEKVFDSVSTTPATIEEAAALAGTAAAVANLALSMLSGYAELVERLSAAPVAAAALDADDFTPAIALGTLGQQNADAVAITGGTIDGTTIGATTASTGAFTTLSATGQISSTVATGTAPLAVASVTKVANLNADLLDGGDWAAPGTIGSTTPNSGAFTTLSASGAVALSPTSANVVLAPTGTGVVTINPATLGAMDKVAIGGTTPAAVAATTLSATTSSVGLPGIYLGTENTTGFYRIGADRWGYAIAGVKAIDYEASTVIYSINLMTTLLKSFHCYTAQYGMGTPDSDGLQIFAATGDTLRFGHRSGALAFTEDMRIDASGDVKVYNKFGCNGKAPQAAVASGGTLAGVIAALVANGILLS